MKNPKVLETILAAATFRIPTFKVTDEGIVDGDGMELLFCKGDRSNPEVHRQEGVFSETLITTVLEYLREVNKGEMATRETSMVITKLEEALMWMQKRTDDRILREVQGTYQK